MRLGPVQRALKGGHPDLPAVRGQPGDQLAVRGVGHLQVVAADAVEQVDRHAAARLGPLGEIDQLRARNPLVEPARGGKQGSESTFSVNYEKRYSDPCSFLFFVGCQLPAQAMEAKSSTRVWWA